MKRQLSFFICCLFTAFAWAGGDVVVKSGNIAVFNQKEKTELVIDYSVAKVNDMTLDGYLKSRGEDFVRDWPNDAKTAKVYFVARFNKKNKKGLQITETGSSNYKMVIQVKTLDMGSTGATVGGQLNPFNFSTKTGGAVISALVEIINKATGKSLCCIEVDDIKGMGSYSETARLGMAYFELASKILKEAKNADADGDFTETEPITLAGGAVGTASTTTVKATTSNTTTGKVATKKQQAAAKKAVAVAETSNENTEVLAVLANAKGMEIPRRRKPVIGDFSNIAKQSKIGAYLDFSDADIDGRTESEFIQYMETTADGDDLDPNFGENWGNVKESLTTTLTSIVNKELKDEKLKLKFTSSLDTDYILKMEVVSVDDDGNNKINYLFVNMKTGEVEAQITCESKGGHFGRYIGLLKQGFESGGEDFSELLLDQID